MYVRINENGRFHEQAHGDRCANNLKTILGSEEQNGTMQHVKHFSLPVGLGVCAMGGAVRLG